MSARITREDAIKLGIKLAPIKSPEQKKRENKYGAILTEVRGIKFDSKGEAERYMDLRLLEKAGEISHLELQPKFLLQEKFTYDGKTERKISYIADFEYCDIHGTAIVEDFKGMRTEIFKLKRKLFLHKYGHLYKFIET